MANTVANLTAVLQMNNSKFKSGLASSQKSLTGFQKQVKSLGNALATTFAVTSVVAFGRSAFQALDTQRKAEASLLTALKGRVSVQAELMQQAKQLQKETLFGDEETIRAQALAASMGLTHEQIKKLIPAAMDLSAAMGQTLEFGVKNLARTFGGLSGELGEIMPALRNLTAEEMKAGKAIDLVNKLMGGQAKAAADADTSLTQLKNKWGDFKEVMAALILDLGPATKELFGAMSDKHISVWDKFLALFDYTKALEISAIASAFDDVENSVRKLSAMERGIADLYKYQAGYVAPPPKSKSPGGFSDMTEIQDILLQNAFANLFTGRAGGNQLSPIGGMTSDQFGARMDMSDRIDKTMEATLASLGAFSDQAITEIDKVEGAAESLGHRVGIMLVSQFDSLGVAIGQSMSGSADSIRDLGNAVMQNLGNILIMYGSTLGPAGLPFMIAGAALQFGGGFFKGLGSNVNTSSPGGSGFGKVEFRVKDDELVGFLKAKEDRKWRIT